MALRNWRWGALTLAALLVLASARAQEDKEVAPLKEPTKEEAEAQAKERLANAKRQLKGVDLRFAGGDEKAIALIDRPLLTFGDAERKHENGTLWAWGDVGRPVAFLELWQGSIKDADWMYSFTLTSKDRVITRTPIRVSWTPQKPQIDPQPIPGAPEPVESAAARLRQIKEISRRFTAHEFWDDGRHELRLLVQPIHRYSNPKQEIQDGAVFVLAHGTNPEMLLLIEALGKTTEAARWHYSTARTGHAELHLNFDEKELWKSDRVGRITPEDPYWLFKTQTEVEP